ncbi:type VI secretion system tip protein TssI/VgrG [Francisella tularensis]|uniref:type VI secretion system tip protein TssI/VgrG n=1 Tax=Francisella tularensis TaxID=263 RepID=UPI00398BC9F0
MSKADHIFNLEEQGLLIDIKDDSKGCTTKLESSGKITHNATESIESSADKQIIENVKDSKISITEKEILLATKKSSIMLSEDKIVIKIGNSLIILDDSNISLESATII